MTIKLCSPSWRRTKLPTSRRYGDVVYYIDPTDEEAYKGFGVDYVVLPEGVQGNFCRVRNYVLDYEFGNGADGVVFFDDDISYIGLMEPKGESEKGYRNVKLEQDELWQFIEDSFQLCSDLGLYMWGVNCSNEPNAYMRNTPFSLSTYIASPFVGFITNEIRYDEDLFLKEDYDMTMQHMHRFGGALRMNMAFTICAQACKGNGDVGGCSTSRNMMEERRQFDELQRKWGSDIVRRDRSSKRAYDLNPILRVPIAGV